jgi:adenine-specific DNA-methyltransferase
LYRENRAALVDRFDAAMRQERRILGSGSLDEYRRAATAWRHVGNDPDLAAEACILQKEPNQFPYRLASITFAWGYFGLTQSIEIDSVRYAIDEGRRRRLITPEQERWASLALLQAASRIASTPGHFAQFLRGDSSTGLQRVLASRRRAAWDAFLEDLDWLAPFGTARWRGANKVFRQDALELWSTLDDVNVGRAIYYADPPYSKEHYSRFYHVLETLTRYDYPQAEGAGRYRPDRFQTAFALKTKVEAAIAKLCDKISERKSTLILSYPSSGLLTDGLGRDIGELLGEHFGSVRLALERPAQHSTLGARHGRQRQSVTEYVWVAQ